MNKRLIFLVIVFILAIGSVSAADFTNHEFDGYFTMDVPKGTTFEKEINETNESGISMVMASYMSEDLVVMYMGSPAYSQNSSSWFFQSFFESMYPELSKCYERQEGNLKILEPTTINETYYPILWVSSGNKTVMIAGEDLDKLKLMGNSIRFQ